MPGKHAGEPEPIGTDTQRLIRELEIEANQLHAQLISTGLGPHEIRRRTLVLTEIYRLKALDGEMRRYVQ